MPKRTLSGQLTQNEQIDGMYAGEIGFDTGVLSASRWTDTSFPATLAKQGANSKPDFDFTDLGLLFPQNDPTEKIYAIDQMLHSKELGTGLRLHVHFVQTSISLPTFKADYRFYNNGSTIPSYTTMSTDEGAGTVFTYPGSGSIIQILRFPEIPAPVDEIISANLDVIFYRDDNVVTGDVLVKYVDFHYRENRAGSPNEYDV